MCACHGQILPRIYYTGNLLLARIDRWLRPREDCIAQPLSHQFLHNLLLPLWGIYSQPHLLDSAERGWWTVVHAATTSNAGHLLHRNQTEAAQAEASLLSWRLKGKGTLFRHQKVVHTTKDCTDPACCSSPIKPDSMVIPPRSHPTKSLKLCGLIPGDPKILPKQTGFWSWDADA